MSIERLEDVDERVRVYLRTAMSMGLPMAPSQLKDRLHIGYKRAAQVLQEVEFKSWPALGVCRCVCGKEFPDITAHQTHAQRCPKWNNHLPQEKREAHFRGPTEPPMPPQQQQQQQTLLVGAIGIGGDPLSPAALHKQPPMLNTSTIVGGGSMLSGIVLPPSALTAQFQQQNPRQAAADFGATYALFADDDDATGRRHIYFAPNGAAMPVRNVLTTGSGAPPVSTRIAYRAKHVVPSADSADASVVPVDAALQLTVVQRRAERERQTRREQWLDAAREAARYNAALDVQRQRRGPFYSDPHTNAIEVLPVRLVRSYSSAYDRLAASQSEASKKNILL